MGALVNSLPINKYRGEILTAVDHNQVVIITAETGAGKSTQVPQYLAEVGYDKVIVTQPRILAARNLCQRVREEWAERFQVDSSALIGYRTSHERDDNPENIILYCTDGLQLVRELTGSGTKSRQILVLDEIHEWNENMEVLIAWARKRCAEDTDFKVLLMSATLEADALVAYFGGAGILNIPGRTHKVTTHFSKNLILELINRIEMSDPSNILVFLPGKAEIELVTDAIGKKAAAANIPVIPLHSQLDPGSQQRAFAHYTNGKIILATNIAQTSITIDDIDVVIDSGLERRSEIRSGVEGLFISEISQADCLQRAGRAGRTKEGHYILARLDQFSCSPIKERPAYGVPEILRKHIDRLVLRLASIDIDIETLEFYHSPKERIIKLAKAKLFTLGALDKQGKVTEIGSYMEKFPVQSGYARMLVEAEKFSRDIQSKLAAIIAIQEVEGIVRSGTKHNGWKRFTNQKRSDLLGQYEVYLALPLIDPIDFDELGIIGRNITKAEDIMSRLRSELNVSEIPLTGLRSDEIEPLLRCIVTGQLDQLWAVQPYGEVVHLLSNDRRELSSGTLVRSATVVAATPFDLEIQTANGAMETLRIVTDVTAVETAWLGELAPHLYEVTEGKIFYDPDYGTLARRTHLHFNGHKLQAAGRPILDHTPENERLFVKKYAEWAHEKLVSELDGFKRRSSRRPPSIPMQSILNQTAYVAGGIISIHELDKKKRLELEKLTKLETFLSKKELEKLSEEHRSHTHTHKRRFKWRPRHHRKNSKKWEE